MNDMNTLVSMLAMTSGSRVVDNACKSITLGVGTTGCTVRKNQDYKSSGSDGWTSFSKVGGLLVFGGSMKTRLYYLMCENDILNLFSAVISFLTISFFISCYYFRTLLLGICSSDTSVYLVRLITTPP